APFEASVDPIRFDRLPDARGRDPEVLERLAGSYVRGPVELVVARKGADTLTVGTPGNPSAELTAVRGLRFAAKEQPTTTFEFVLDASGGVEKLIVQPLGVFDPK